MNIIKTADALQVWLEKHKVRFATSERINGELPRYIQSPSCGPDDAVIVIVLVPKRDDFLESEVVPFSVHKRSDFPDRPKAQFKESDTLQSGAEFLTSNVVTRIDPKIMDPNQVDGPQPNTEGDKEAVVRSMSPNGNKIVE